MKTCTEFKNPMGPWASLPLLWTRGHGRLVPGPWGRAVFDAIQSKFSQNKIEYFESTGVYGLSIRSRLPHKHCDYTGGTF